LYARRTSGAEMGSGRAKLGSDSAARTPAMTGQGKGAGRGSGGGGARCC
jgi:hypothetical protein